MINVFKYLQNTTQRNLSVVWWTIFFFSASARFSEMTKISKCCVSFEGDDVDEILSTLNHLICYFCYVTIQSNYFSSRSENNLKMFLLSFNSKLLCKVDFSLVEFRMSFGRISIRKWKVKFEMKISTFHKC